MTDLLLAQGGQEQVLNHFLNPNILFIEMACSAGIFEEVFKGRNNL